MKKGAVKKVKREKGITSHSFSEMQKNVKNLSEHEVKELLLINMYKMALMRAQLETLTNIIIKNRLADFEEIWKETNENFKNTV